MLGAASVEPVARLAASGAGYCRPLIRRESSPKAFDGVVTEAYSKLRSNGDLKALSRAADVLGVPIWHVKTRGRELGLSRVKEKPWSEREIEILEAAAWRTDRWLARKLQSLGFPRTPTAVHLKLKRMNLRANVDGYNQRQLAQAFGVDGGTISRWVKFGWLHGSRRGTERADDLWYFSHAAVRKFAMMHPDEIDLCKVEKFWFLDLITDGKICR